jgi:sucrose phosphorylase
MKNQVQLITYVDRLSAGGFRDLTRLIEGPLADVFGGVHVLPFFDPIDGSDAGFDPIDHTKVDPRLGDWGDIKALGQHVEVMADVIVNHMSSRSPQFLDFSRNGKSSPYAQLFLTLDKVFPDGATERDLTAIYRPRPGVPFTVMTLQNGERRVLWTTFTPQQVDIDVDSEAGRAYLEGILRTLAANGVRMVRLDAIGYSIKRAGSSCFMTAETFAFIDRFATTARALGLEVLVEIHSYYRRQVEIARKVDWVYDFALPPLVLHAFAFGTGARLAEWLRVRPANAITVLDTHDGIGIIDIGADAADRAGSPGLVPPNELDRLVELIHEQSNGASRLATGEAASNLDLYQVNCTFYDAMGRNDLDYLLARAVQFFCPGIPQVYYVGLLAGENDLELLTRTRVGRDINRHYYRQGEVEAMMARPVVRDLVRLIRLRNSHPAFNGEFCVEQPSPTSLTLRWAAGAEWIALTVCFASRSHSIRYTEGGAQQDFQLRRSAANAA